MQNLYVISKRFSIFFLLSSSAFKKKKKIGFKIEENLKKKLIRNNFVFFLHFESLRRTNKKKV
jgi:hypothetical protein